MIKLFSVKVRVMCLKADTSEVRHEAVDCIHSSCRCLERMWQDVASDEEDCFYGDVEMHRCCMAFTALTLNT